MQAQVLTETIWQTGWVCMTREGIVKDGKLPSHNTQSALPDQIYQTQPIQLFLPFFTPQKWCRVRVVGKWVAHIFTSLLNFSWSRESCKSRTKLHLRVARLEPFKILPALFSVYCLRVLRRWTGLFQVGASQLFPFRTSQAFYSYVKLT